MGAGHSEEQTLQQASWNGRSWSGQQRCRVAVHRLSRNPSLAQGLGKILKIKSGARAAPDTDI